MTSTWYDVTEHKGWTTHTNTSHYMETLPTAHVPNIAWDSSIVFNRLWVKLEAAACNIVQVDGDAK